MILGQCKGVHCVDLGESFQTHIFLQNFVSIQPRLSPCPKPRIPTDPPRNQRVTAKPAKPGVLDVLPAQARRGGDLLEARLAGEVAPREGTHQGQLTAALLDRANLTGLVLGWLAGW